MIFQLLSILCLCFAWLSADPCVDPTHPNQYIRRNILNRSEKQALVYMPCQKMTVPKGHRVSIKGDVYLSFVRPSPQNVIYIEGKLTLDGGDSNFVTVSSKVDTTQYWGYTYSEEEAWQGFRVLPGGKLILNNVMIYGAKVPIITESKNVVLKQCYFHDSDFMLAKTRYVALLIGNKTVDYFNFKWTQGRDKNIKIQVFREHRTAQVAQPPDIAPK